MPITPLQAVFFDLGGTLVRPVRDQPRTEWIEGAKESIAELVGKDVRIGLLSNTDDLSRERLFGDLLPADFPAESFEENLIILSSEVGVEKPKLQIFAQAIDQAGLLPVLCLFLTEELPHALAAQQMGMRAVCVQMGDVERVIRDLVDHNLVVGG